MKVFLSWSGDRSRRVARALREWLPLILQDVEPWMSEKDIEAGERWSIEIGRELEGTAFGVICLTSDNLTAPWILFEAGALSKAMDAGAVCPYLLDVPFQSLVGPLSQFQAKKADREQTLSLIQSLNGKSQQPTDPVRVSRYFEKFWPDLEAELASIPAAAEGAKREPGQVQILEELVTLSRGLDHRMRSLEAKVTPTRRSTRRKRPPYLLEGVVQVHLREADAAGIGKQKDDTFLTLSNDAIRVIARKAGLPPGGFGTDWFLWDDAKGVTVGPRDIDTFFDRGRVSVMPIEAPL